MQSVNCHILQSIGGMAHMMLNCDWMPIFLRPFVSGIFWLLVVLAFLNYKIIVGFGNDENSNSHTTV